MTTVTKHVVFLQYPKVGEIGPSGHRMTDGKFSYAEKFVAIDGESGGYPYGVDIDRAHDFKTVEEAEKYSKSFVGLSIREVTITYEF